MQVLVIRHAIAVDREEFKKQDRDDAFRPLTKPGRRKMRKAARGLRTVISKVDVLATSPLTRALETAEILSEAFDGAKIQRRSELIPSKRPSAIGQWLAGLKLQKKDAAVMLVGHEPHLGLCIGWMLSGLQDSFITLKKGGACLLEFPDAVKPGQAKLLWTLTPGQLRRLRKV